MLDDLRKLGVADVTIVADTSSGTFPGGWARGMPGRLRGARLCLSLGADVGDFAALASAGGGGEKRARATTGCWHGAGSGRCGRFHDLFYKAAGGDGGRRRLLLAHHMRAKPLLSVASHREIYSQQG